MKTLISYLAHGTPETFFIDFELYRTLNPDELRRVVLELLHAIDFITDEQTKKDIYIEVAEELNDFYEEG